MKDIPGYDGRYTIADDGTIYNKKGKIVKYRVSSRGYHRVNLSNGKEIKTHRVHRLVAITYIPTEDKSLEVDHIDGNKNNNHVSNLRWCTGKENVGYHYEMYPEKKSSKPVPRTAEEMEVLYAEKGTTIVVNSITYRSVTSAANMIATNEGKQLDTIRKELRKYVQGKRPEWCMYGKYNIGW